MGFRSWLTGRDEKAADVYANREEVTSLTEQITNISGQEVNQAADAVRSALRQLNNVPGLNNYVGTIESSAFDGVFIGINNSLTGVNNQIRSKVAAIVAYSEATPEEVIGSTLAMTLTKAGEGVLSIAEDLGDGVVSVVGWASGVAGSKDFQKACEKFIKSEWSHDAFNFYYNSDFAKKSAYTEDSALASGVKITGAVAGYVALTLATAGAGGGTLATNVASKLGCSTTTLANTVFASVAGMGSGTEGGLNKGLSFDNAFGEGIMQGAIQGALAFGIGKAGDKMAQKVQNSTPTANTTTELSTQSSETAVNNTSSQTFKSTATNVQNAEDEAINAARKEVENLKALKLEAENNYKIARSGNVVEGSQEHRALAELANKKQIAIRDLAKAEEKLNKLIEAQNTGNVANKATSVFNKNSTGELSTITEKGSSAMSLPDKSALPAIATETGSDAVANVAKVAMPTISAHNVASATLNAAGREYVYQDSKNSGEKAGEQFKKKVPKDATNNDKVNRDLKVNGNSPITVNKDNDITPNSNEDNNGAGYNDYSGKNTNEVSPSGGGYSNYPGGNSSPRETLNQNTTIGESIKKEVNPGVQPTPQKPSTTPTEPTKPSTEPTTPTTPTSPSSPTTPTNPGTNNNNPVTNTPSNPGANTSTHTGGGGNRWTGTSTVGASKNVGTTIEEAVTDSKTAIEDVVKGSKYTKIPTSSTPLTAASGNGGSSVIPIVAGLSAAAAAGIGAKVYMDHRRNADNDELDEIDTEDWSDEDTIEVEYENTSEKEAYLDEDDDYGYQAEEQTERYDARSNEELADLQ